MSITRNKAVLMKGYLLLAALEALAVFLFLVNIPSDAKNAVFLGLSASRVLLSGFVLTVFLTALFFLFKVEHISNHTDSLLKKPAIFVITVLMVGCTWIFLLTPATVFGIAIYQRLAPVVWLAMALAIQTLVLRFIWLDQKLRWEGFFEQKKLFKVTGIVFLLFALLAMAIAWTRVGIQPEASGWFPPGTPILAQQVLGALFAGLILLFLERRLKWSEQANRWDYVIGVSIWLVASIVWLQQPLERWSYFTPKPTPPNFEYYPYSDSALYDQFAQHVLMGNSRQVGLTHRPLYSFFLAALHAIGGQDFDTLIMLQILILGSSAMLVYLLVSHLGGRSAGLVAALLLILREKNSIELTNIIEVSHVKLIMSDFPTLTMMLLFIYFLVTWLKNDHHQYHLGALAGALFGLVILIRSQAQLLIPVVLIGIAISRWNGWRAFFTRSAVFLAGIFLVLAPWVWRNYQLSGRVVVEYQEFYTRIIASGYATSLDETELHPGETSDHYRERMKALILEYILRNPFEVARFYSSYFLHNEIASVVYLPMTIRFEGIYDYVKTTGFWSSVFSFPPARFLPAFFLSLGLIGLGIGAAFWRLKWVGLLPLFFHFGYSLSVVPVRMSGWRYILPVDWVSFVYFSIGLIQLSLILTGLFSNKLDHGRPLGNPPEVSPASGWRRTMLTLLVAFVVGLSIPLIEWSIPERYPRVDAVKLIHSQASHVELADQTHEISADRLISFLENEPRALVAYGQAFYPSYYEHGKYWGENSSLLIEASQYDRLQFQLLGPQNYFVYLPLQSAPVYFPNASEVFVVGCKGGHGVRALLVKVNDAWVTSSLFEGLTCSGP